MAGPCAGVLLRRRLTEQEQGDVRRELEELGAVFEGNDFRMSGRPFCVTFGPEYPGEFDELARDGLPAVLGWLPVDELGLCAMCNDESDHRVLGELCVRFARKFGGVIDFGGRLPVGVEVKAARPWEPVRLANPSGLKGVLLATTYRIAEGAYGTTHFGDADLLEAWLQHPDFRMVK